MKKPIKEEIPLDPIPEPKPKEDVKHAIDLIEQDIIKPEVNMSMRRDTALTVFIQYLRDSTELRQILKHRSGKYTCVYDCSDIGMKWTMTIKEERA